MSNQKLNFIRLYFLSFDQKEQEGIYASLSEDQRDLIIEVGNAFLSKEGLSLFSENLYFNGLLGELKDIQLEYFIGLSEMLADGKSNEIVEKLLSSKNLLFEQIISEFGNNSSFENDLFNGFKKIERDEIKEYFSILDENENNIDIPDKEIQYAVSQIEWDELKSKFKNIETESTNKPNIISNSSLTEPLTPIKLEKEGAFVVSENIYQYSPASSRLGIKRYIIYTAAACVSFLLIGISAYLFMDRQQLRYAKPPDKNTKRDFELLDTSIISGEKRIKVPVLKNYNRSNKDSLNITIHDILIQQEEYRILFSEETEGKKTGFGPRTEEIRYSIDSLKKIENTYILLKGSLILNLRNIPKEIKLFSIKEVNGKQLILKIEDRFYLLSQNIFVLPLTPIVDSKLINTIQSTYLSEIDKQ